VPSADALFGRTAPSPRPAPRRRAPAAADGRAPRPRRRATAPPADEGVLRRLDQLEAALSDLPIDRLIELRERLEVMLAAGSVDADELRSLLELGGG
jgi:hypothetical protein